MYLDVIVPVVVKVECSEKFGIGRDVDVVRVDHSLAQ